MYWGSFSITFTGRHIQRFLRNTPFHIYFKTPILRPPFSMKNVLRTDDIKKQRQRCCIWPQQ